METGGMKRLRLRFKEQNILSVAQEIDGLKRCWFIFDPDDLQTISALASHLVHKFELISSCPSGIVLSMEGYALPPFESTRILLDKDIISVKRKCAAVAEAIDVGGQENSTEDSQYKQPALPGRELLAITEFEEETDRCMNGLAEANDMSGSVSVKKKRKRSRQAHGSKKKARSTSLERDQTFSVESADGTPAEHNGNSRKKKRRKVSKKILQEDNSSNVSSEPEEEGSPELEKKSDELEENDQETENASDVHDTKKKCPSRSARRKKAKRIWLREQAKLQNKEVGKNCLPAKDTHKKSHENEKNVQNFDRDDVVPIIVRPGHIRFEPLEGSDQELQNSGEIFQWRGTTSKKKGQKWGKEKTSFQRRDSVENSDEEVALDNSELAEDPLDFEKLSPMTSSPKEGDVLAYRLVELSSSWCPELSPFRVGKISTYDPVSKRITLLPVPEHPITSKDEDNEAAVVPSVYSEDGSLEVDFASLVDVRIFSSNKPDPLANNTAVQSNETQMIHDIHMAPASVKENGGQLDAWEEISKALYEKKSQLLQKEYKEKSANTSWSYRALRGSALGPTIAMLRAQNNIS